MKIKNLAASLMAVLMVASSSSVMAYATDANFGIESNYDVQALASDTDIGPAVFTEGNFTYSIISDKYKPSYISLISYEDDGITTDIIVPDTVNDLPVITIGQNAFKDNTTIKTVTLPDSIEEIDSYAFYGCTALASINTPKSLKYVNNEVFYNCVSLKEINLLGLRGIGSRICGNCTSLETVSFSTISDYYTYNSRYLNNTYINDKNYNTVEHTDTFEGCENIKNIITNYDDYRLEKS